MANEDLHQQFVKFMVKKANVKEKEPDAFTLLNPAKKDEPTTSHDHRIDGEDIKKVEEHVERFKKSIK